MPKPMNPYLIIIGVILIIIAGYFIMTNKKPIKPNNSLPPVTAEELARGWYWGEDKRPGTPESWVHQLGETKSARWYDPNKLSLIRPSYGQKVKYVQGQPIQFPDFTLEFLGTRRQESSLRVSLGDLYDFKITSDGQTQSISWSSGTGGIAPKRFKIARRKLFDLELLKSDKLGKKLEPGELVISEVGEDMLPAYRRPIWFAGGEVLEFPDFDLKFIGSEEMEIPYSPEQIEMFKKTNTSVPAGMQKITVYNFEVTKDGKTQKVTYSPTEHPLKFTIPWGITRMPVTLEIGVSSTVNPDWSPINLSPGTLVITTYPPFPI